MQQPDPTCRGEGDGEAQSETAQDLSHHCDSTHFDDTSTRTGLFKLARCSFATLVVMVAENKYVFRSFGITLRILSMMGPKSISSSRSASSMTCSTNFSLVPRSPRFHRDDEDDDPDPSVELNVRRWTYEIFERLE